MATSGDLSAFTGIEFPLSEDVPAAMACIPEFTADNIIDFMLFLKRFQDGVYEVWFIEHWLELHFGESFSG